MTGYFLCDSSFLRKTQFGLFLGTETHDTPMTCVQEYQLLATDKQKASAEHVASHVLNNPLVNAVPDKFC